MNTVRGFISAAVAKFYTTYTPLENSFMTAVLLVKARIGRTAKGNCILISTLSISFSPVRSFIPSKAAMKTVGNIAMLLVSNTLCHFFQLRFRKP